MKRYSASDERALERIASTDPIAANIRNHPVSKTPDTLNEADRRKHNASKPFEADRWNHDRRFEMVTVSSKKGGIGKTTWAANLAA